jgi:type I restriction enzyme M protein
MSDLNNISQDALFDNNGAVGSEQSANGASPNSTRASRRAKVPLTSREQLNATIKSVRDLLRKDAGLAGDTDRLPQLTWLLFLKNLDDFEYAQEEELGEEYEPVIAHPYRWRDWAAVEDKTQRLTGDELLDFVNNDLITYLGRLSGSGEHDIRTIIGTIFQGTYNRIRSGYILREVVDKLSNINFNSSDDIHAVSHFYETMLREMRDSAGDAGEFYTPRPVVRFIIDRLAPKLGERILDPACGTCGFLVEAYEHLREAARSPEQHRELQDSLMGIEKKSMPYLLGVMNLLLHGIEYPNIVELNALSTNTRQVRDAERVDVVATNPPFGGEEERGILNNFPEGMRTSETALLYFQYVMAMLKRPGGRCGIVLPNGFLFGGGVAAEVKRQLLNRFNLHTIVRLPNGVFAPYTNIPTNLVFFKACEPDCEEPCTREVWYYELPLPEGRNNYTKTKPLQYEEFADCLAWWENREENERAWKVPVEWILANECNLDIKNPNKATDLEHLPPDQLVDNILNLEQLIIEATEKIRQILGRSKREYSNNNFPLVQLSELLMPISRPEPVVPERIYSILGAHWYAKGLYIKDVKLGSDIQADKIYRVEEGDFVYNRLFAWKGSFAIASANHHGCYVSNEFPCFRVKQDKLDGL